MDRMENIIRENKGIIIINSSDIFVKSKFKCKNNHIFDLYNNDVLLNKKWCSLCKEENFGLKVLKELGINYEENFVIENVVFEYVFIRGDKKFLFYTDINKLTIAQKHKFKSVIFNTNLEKNSKEKIWNSVLNNNDLMEDKKVEESIKLNHKCNLEKILSKEKDNTGSMIKYAPKPYPQNNKIAYGYIRVSTSMQVNDGFSLEAQENKIYKETEYRNFFLKSLYIDRGISGGSTENRKALNEMMEEIMDGEEEIWIIINSISRLSRKTKDLLTLVEDIERKNCHLIIIDLNLDITSPSGKLMLTMMAGQAQFERELTSERVKNVLQHLKETGNLRTKPSFGWMLNPDRSSGAKIHIRNEKEQKVIQKIRDYRNENPGMGITEFTRLINENIKPPRKSRDWYHKNLRQLMEREGIK